ncbi:hypothetical protein V6U71_21470 [Sphingopyxis sp. J-6]|uniref:hypothetical protein n=1 Tax=Sphingopyxis sp. J-6 TaxID=3122054 RepID=UPI003983FAC7
MFKLVFLLLFAVEPNASKPPYEPRPISAADKAKIVAEADKLLFDGPAARWQWGLRKSDFIYCGFVNGKNRMGAYVGWTPFYYTDRGLRIISPGDSTITYEGLCSSAGYIEKPEWLEDK